MVIKLPQPTFGFQLPSFNKKPTEPEQEAPMSRIPAQEKEPPMSRIPGDFSTPGLKSDLEKKFTGDTKFEMPKLDMSSAWGMGGINQNIGATPYSQGIKGTNFQQFPDEVKQSIGSDIQQQNLQKTQPAQATNTVQMIGELQYDIQQGANDEQIMQAYPELGTNETISQLRYDIEQGATPEQIAQAYPELGITPEPMKFGDVEWKNPLLRAGVGLVKGAIGAVKGAYEGLVPGFKEMIQDSKRIISDPNKSAPEKFNQILFGEIGADYIGGAIGDTFGGALGGLYEGFATSTEREFINQKVQGVMEGIIEKEPIQNIMKKYNQLQPEEQQELNDLMGYAMNAMEFVGIGLLAKPAKEAGVRGLKVGKEILQDTLGETTEQVGKQLTKIGEFSPIESTAKAFTKTAKPQDKLFKAQNPSLNVLNKNRDFKTVRHQSDLANQLVVDAGHIPVDTETRRIAHESTMKSKWAEVEGKVADKKELMVDQNQFADILDDVVRDAKESGLVKNKSDIMALEAEAKAMRKQGAIDLPTLEKRKQYINGIVNNWGDSDIGDVYKNGMKKVTRAIGEVEDVTLAKIPGEFSALKKEFGALKSTYEDILKADIKNQKSKGADIMQTYSRIEGISDIIGGTMSIFTRGSEGIKDVAKGVGKLFMGKALKKATDPDFLVKEGFKGLSPKIKPNVTKNFPMTNMTDSVSATPKKNIQGSEEILGGGIKSTTQMTPRQVNDMKIKDIPDKKADYQKKFSSMSNEEKIKEQFGDIQQSTKIAQVEKKPTLKAKQAPKLPKANNETIPQSKVMVKAPEEPLMVEARKYKSAEEFENSFANGGPGREFGRGEGFILAERGKNLYDFDKSKIEYYFKDGKVPDKITLYRGANTNKTNDLVPGDYLSRNRNVAGAFGTDIKKYEISSKDLTYGKGKDDFVYIKGVDEVKIKAKQIREEANKKGLQGK